MAMCRFMIGTSSGPLWVPPLFGKPVLWTNATGILKSHYFPKSKMLPRKIIEKTSGKILNLTQLAQTGIGYSDLIPEILSNQFSYVDNSSQEIESAVSEMLNDERTVKKMDLDLGNKIFFEFMSMRGLAPTTQLSSNFCEKESAFFVSE
jgi:putative glycosyltransferase (TIGR04372 family)